MARFEQTDAVMEEVRKLDRDLRDAAKMIGRRQARYLTDMYYQIQEFRKTAASQTRAASQQAEPNQVLTWVLDSMKQLESNIRTSLGEFASSYNVGQWLQSITGIGPVLSAGFLCHLDIKKAETYGHFWRFAGLDPTAKWLSREGTKKALVQILAKEKDASYGPEDIVRIYTEVAREARIAREEDVVAAAQLIDKYGISLVRSVIPTLARCHNRDKLYGIHISNFADKFGQAVVFFKELCQTHELIEAPEDAPINFATMRLVADHFGRNPFNLFKSAQRGGSGNPTVESTASALSKRPWNAKLKVLCYKAADCFMKFQNHKDDHYGKLYAQRKAFEVANSEGGKLADQAAQALKKKNFGKDTEARAWYEGGKLPPAHLHARALRWTEKLFLSHLHSVMYVDYYKKDPPVPYVMEHVQGDHRHMIPIPNFPFNGDGKELSEMEE